jgi:flagellar hook-associated protein 3 FlgL
MRVTENLRYGQVNQRLASLREQYHKASVEATTGQRVNAPSDDPVAAADAIRTGSALTQNESFQRNIDLVRGDAEMAEASLAEAGTVLQRALELAMQGSNDSNSATQRNALAIEAQQLVSQFIQIANTKGSQGYLFSGTATDTPAFDQAGVFQGNDAGHVIQTGTGITTVANVSGAQAFTAIGGRDVIQDLQAFAAALSTNDTTTIKNSLDTLQRGHDQVARERSQAGLLINRLDLSATILTDTSVSLNKHQTETIGANTDDVYTRLIQLESSINDSVTVSKRLLSLTNIERF